MALKLGISTDRLISYEFGRVKLPWSVGHDVCVIFQVNPLWLYDGTGEKWCRDTWAINQYVPAEASGTFAAVLKDGFQKSPDLHAFFLSAGRPENERGSYFLTPATYELINQFSPDLNNMLNEIPPARVKDFLQALAKAGKELVPRFRGTTRKGAAQKTP